MPIFYCRFSANQTAQKITSIFSLHTAKSNFFSDKCCKSICLLFCDAPVVFFVEEVQMKNRTREMKLRLTRIPDTHNEIIETKCRSLCFCLLSRKNRH